MRKLLFAYLLLSSSLVNAQIESIFEYQIPDTVPSNYRQTRENIYFETLETLEKNKDKNLSNREAIIEDYAKMFASVKSSFFNSGYIYIGWNEPEKYLNDVFRVLTKGHPEVDTSFKIYISKLTDFNAFATYDKSLYVNLGLLAYMEDEAQLAAVLSHEFGHYLHYDSFDYFVRARRTENATKATAYMGGLGLIIGGINEASFLAKMRAKERASDDMIFELFSKSGYSLESASGLFQLLDIHQNSEEMVSGSSFSFNFLGSSHPKSLERSQKFKNYVETNNGKYGNKFIVSASMFEKVRTSARNELLKVHLENGDYHNCITSAFEFYLLDSSNQLYVYYILESLRRWEIMNKKSVKLKFITDSPTIRNRVNLLENLAGGYLKLPRQSIGSTNAKELLDQNVTEFKTNAEAFTYFSKIAENTNCKECKLTIALKHKDNPSIFQTNLNNYINTEGVKHKEFALALTNNQLKNHGDKVAVFLNPYMDVLDIIEDSDNDSLVLENIQMICKKFLNASDSIIKLNSSVGFYTNTENYWENFGRTNQITDMTNFHDIYLYSNPIIESDELIYDIKLESSRKKANAIQWYMVNPEYWEYLNRFKCTRLLFISTTLSKFSSSTKRNNHQLFYTKGCKFLLKWHSTSMSLGQMTHNKGSNYMNKIKQSNFDERVNPDLINGMFKGSLTNTIYYPERTIQQGRFSK